MNEIIVKSLLKGTALHIFEKNQKDALQQLKEETEWKVFYKAGMKPSDYTFINYQIEVCPVEEGTKIISLKYKLDYLPDMLMKTENIEIKK
jgi:hypothetical protein